MLTATRLIAAIAIASLGAGALLFSAGVGPSRAPVASPSPAPWMPPAGWVTEELEPGVVRIVSDGVRDLGLDTVDWPADELAIGPDGTVWTSSPLRRLGDPASPPAPHLRIGSLEGLDRLRVDADGMPWVGGQDGVLRFDGSAWVSLRTGSTRFDIGADGTAWAASPWGQPFGEMVLSRLTPSGWEDVPIGLDLAATLGVQPADIVGSHAKGFRVAPDGSVWLGLAVLLRDDEFGHLLLRFDGDSWEAIDPLGVRSYFDMATFAIGADGTAWVYLDTGSSAEPHLARLSAGAWTVYSAEDGVFPVGSRGSSKGHLEVDRSGTAWMVPASCGVRSFDGSVWRTYLENVCARDLDVAPDGGVWVVSGDVPAGDGRIYRIDPEVASREP